VPTLASLTLHVGASTSGLTSGLTRGAAAVSTFAHRADARMRSFGRSMGSRGRSAGSTLMSAMGSAISAGASGLGSVLQSAAKPGLQLAALALAAGVAAVFASGLIIALSGVAVVGLSALILKDVPKVKKSMGKLMDTAKSVVKNAAKPMIEPLTTMFDDLRGTVKDLAKPLRETFQIVADSGLTKNLSRGLDGMLKAMLNGFNDMLRNAKPVFEAFEGFLVDIGKGVGDFFKAIGWASDDAAVGLGDLGKLIRGILMYLGIMIAALAKEYAIVRGFIERVIRLFIRLYNAIAGSSIPGIVMAIGAWFGRLPTMMVGFASSAVSGVIGFFVRLYQGVTSRVRGAVSAVVGFFAALPGRAGRAVGGLAGAIMSRVTAMRQRMVSAVRDAASRVVSFVAALPGRAGRALGGLASAVGSRVRDAGSRMVNAARDKATSLVSTVRGIPGRARRAVGSLGRVLWNAGASLISGFIDGIKSKIPDVSSTLGGLTAKLTSWKGPESLDKRILTPAGNYVLDGFISGLTQRIPAVRSMLTGLTSDLPGMAASATATIDSAVRVAAPAPRDDRIVLDVDGADEEFKRLMRRMVKFDGGGNVQSTFGSN